MSARGYCTPADVSDFLGRAFSPAEELHALRVLETVEELIDSETGRGWLVGVQTGETFRPADWPDGLLYLAYVPLVTLEEVRARVRLGQAGVVLVEDTDYEVMDLESGVIRLLHPARYDRVQVDYTPVNEVPAPIRDAAAEWVAALMQPALRPDTYGVESFSLPDLSVKFARGAPSGDAPPVAASKLSLYAYPDMPGHS